jgi:hypothetical protein
MAESNLLFEIPCKRLGPRQILPLGSEQNLFHAPTATFPAKRHSSERSQMKTFFACLITCVVSVAGATAGNYYLTKQLLKENASRGTNGNSSGADSGSSDEVGQQLAEINEELESLNGMFNAARNDVMRVYHFAAGHVSYSGRGRGGALFCPECTLIIDLENRQTELDNKGAHLSERLSELKKNGQTDSQEYKDGVAEVNRLQIELNSIKKHLYRSAAIEKGVSTVTNTPAPPQSDNKKTADENAHDKQAEPAKAEGEKGNEAPQEKKPEDKPAADSNDKK